MRIRILLALLAVSTFAYTQTYNKPLKSQNVPVSVLHHKFDPQKTGIQVDMIIPEHRTCHTPEVHAILQAKYGLPGAEEYEREFNKLKNEYISRTKSEGIITIPVIVHVIHNGEPVGSGANISMAQVNSQIEVINEDFRRKTGTMGFNEHTDGADVEIEFALAVRDE